MSFESKNQCKVVLYSETYITNDILEGNFGLKMYLSWPNHGQFMFPFDTFSEVHVQ